MVDKRESHRLRLLGPVQLEWATPPPHDFESRKALALLCYLAVKRQPVSRSYLVEMFWPEKTETRGRGNLSRVLHNISSLLPDSFQASRRAIQFEPSPLLWLDVIAFEELTAAEAWAEATALYRDDFMAGFYLDDSPEFENWLIMEREHWSQRIAQILNKLIAQAIHQTDYEQGLKYAFQLLQQEPWREEVHRDVMRLLAFTGQRSAALAQYKSCRRILAEELNVSPTPETETLYERIRTGQLKPTPAEVVISPPPFLSTSPPDTRSPPFVAREQELQQLNHFLNKALSGSGQVAFVVGEAGSGKTALVQEFIHRSQQQHPNLIVAQGAGNAYGGIGDPYLPFREILELLTGDIETRWSAGTIDYEVARRLWNLIPYSVPVLLQIAPDLLHIFLSSPSLLSRLAGAIPAETEWQSRLEQIIADPRTDNLNQQDLFEQYTKMLQMISQKWPLLIMLDDLQWADTGSISLLFHLGRRLTDHPVLMVGTYRPADVRLNEAEARHPLLAVINEFQRYFGQIHIDLDQAKGWEFVEAFLDTQPNRLSPDFRQALYRHTRGQALFTVETVQRMQEQGDLIQEAEGYWVEGPAINWQTLPARIEGVIGERVERLPPPYQEILQVACVEGEYFTAEIVAQILGREARQVVQQLGSGLDRQYRLVHAQGSHQLKQQRLSNYRFRHILYQKYLYDNLDEAERVYLHEAIASVMEQLYQQQTEEIGLELARHFEAAGQTAKTVHYLYQAGERAVHLSANEEAITHFTKALSLLQTLPDTPERRQQELKLYLAQSAPLTISRGYAAPEVERLYEQAWQLGQDIADPAQYAPILRGLWDYYLVRAEIRPALERAEQFLALAQETQDPIMLMEGHWMMGETFFSLGNLTKARSHQEEAIVLYDAKQYHRYTFQAAQNPGLSCRYFNALTLWLLGYPDQARIRIEDTLKRAKELSSLFDLVSALFFSGILHSFYQEPHMVQARGRAITILSIRYGFILPFAWGTILQGWALQGKAGITRIQQGLADLETTGTTVGRPHYLSLLAGICLNIGRIQVGLKVVEEALTIVDTSGERWIEAELYRLKGELLVACGDETEAEAAFQQALTVARRQKALSLELRAAMSLSRLWQNSTRSEAARRLLTGVYDRFTEGFDTADLKEAQQLLKRL